MSNEVSKSSKIEMPISRTLTINEKLTKGFKHNDYRGFDPFDLLNSKAFNLSQLNRVAFFRLVWLQLGKRSPINYRPLFGVTPQRNPKGVALVILGLLQDYRRSADSSYLLEAESLGQWLLSQCCDPNVWQHPCWGYHFDWQARAFFVPKGTPNIISTVYSARALYQLGKVSGNSLFQETALRAALFIKKFLFHDSGASPYFAYIPGEQVLVHNANLWGAAWVSFATKQNIEGLTESQKTQTEAAVGTSLKCQSDTGYWPYGERDHHQFVDGFHTGYNLEALSIIQSLYPTLAIDENINRGMEYYKSHLIDAEGNAKYYNNSLYPIDTHSFAQAVITLLACQPAAIDWQLVQRVVDTGIARLYLPQQQRFIYQEKRWHKNRVNYMRWSQAWAYYALALYHKIYTEHHHD